MSNTANKQDTHGNHVSVTLVGNPLAQQLKDAAKTGNFYVNTRTGHKAMPQGVTSVHMADLMRPLGLDLYNYHIGQTIVIINSLPTPLTLVATAPNAGTQAGYPAIANFGKDASREHQIPAVFDDPNQAGNKLYGVGAYYFESAGRNSLNYALSFSYKPGGAGPLLAIAFKMEYAWIDAISAVTADLSNFNDIGDFYDRLSNSGNSVPSDVGKDTTLWASFEGTRCLYVWVHDSKSTD